MTRQQHVFGLAMIALSAGPLACDSDGSGTAVATGDGPIADGRYFVAVEIAPAGGIQTFLRADITATVGTIVTFDLYAVSADKTWESPAPVASARNLAIGSDSTFTASLGNFSIPAEASPIGAPVGLENLVLTVQIVDTMTVCGTVEGHLPLLDVALTGSAFKGVVDGTEATPTPESSCAGTGPKVYDSITTCPALSAGVNTMTSAETNRELRVFLPSTLGTDPVPIVFLWHGLGGSSQGILDATGWDDLVDTENFILVVPESAKDADGVELTATSWVYLQPLFDRDNRDLVFFDDALKCLSEQYPVDAKRVYATGMSGGGLMTTMLTLHRADVIAATAPFSGGYTFQDYPTGVRKIPTVVSWGGESDTAYTLDFHREAGRLLDFLGTNGHFHVQCNHNTGHEVPKELIAPVWETLSQLSLDTETLNWTTLPASFPSYCELPN